MLTKIEIDAPPPRFLKNWRLITNQKLRLDYLDTTVTLFDPTKESIAIFDTLDVYLVKESIYDIITQTIIKKNKSCSYNMIYITAVLTCSKCYGIGKLNPIDEIMNPVRSPVRNLDEIMRLRGRCRKNISSSLGGVTFLYNPPSRLLPSLGQKLCDECVGTGINNIDKHFNFKPLKQVINPNLKDYNDF
jgi:hypothetical protein